MPRLWWSTLLAVVLCAAPSAQPANRSLNEALTNVYRLNDYTAFDWITGRYDKGTLTLIGFVRTPNLKRRAEDAARKASGIDEIDNRLEVLPSHAGDDQIRVRAYAEIYASGALERYAPGGTLSASALRELADSGRFGLDAADVGRGPHAIHIIVNAARVLLLGEVRATGDRQQAEARLRSIPGILGVTNQLRVAGQ